MLPQVFPVLQTELQSVKEIWFIHSESKWHENKHAENNKHLIK